MAAKDNVIKEFTSLKGVGKKKAELMYSKASPILYSAIAIAGRRMTWSLKVTITNASKDTSMLVHGEIKMNINPREPVIIRDWRNVLLAMEA